MLTVYCWLLCLYPRSYRHEFGDEMTSVFHDARIELPPAPAAKVGFYGREFCGLLSGALCAHFDRVFGPAISFPRFHMQRQFRFPRSTVFLMCMILASVVLAINRAVNIVEQKKGLPLGATAAWEPMLAALLLTLALIFAVVITVWAVLFATRRTGMHRLGNLHTRPEQR